MDQHPAHTSKTVKDLMESLDLIPLYLPPNSSFLNPIESVWSFIKLKWKSKITNSEGKIWKDNVLE